MPDLKCPNCNSSNLTKLENGFQCKHCNAFIFDPNVTKHIEINETTYTDVAELEKVRAKERAKERDENNSHKSLLYATLLALSLFLMAGIVSVVGNSKEKTEVTAPYKSSSECRDEYVNIVADAFWDAGFTDVQVLPTEDLKSENDKSNNRVSSATINGEKDWDTGWPYYNCKKYPKDSIIRIYYHSPKIDTDSSP